MHRSRTLAILLLAVPRVLAAQHALRYVVRVDPARPTEIQVEMRIGDAAGTVPLAMATHEEYADRYWRYVRDLRAESHGAPLTITRTDSARWNVDGASGDLTVRYELALPADSGRPRASWRPFVSPTGGLVGAVDCLMYLPGHTNAASFVELQLPADWRIATGLTPTPEANVFRAADARTLLDGPILVGALHRWEFDIAGVPHHVALWAAPDASALDTTAFVGVVRRIAGAAVAIFGEPPYRDYTFLFQDAAFGALEHGNSVTIGVSAATLAHDPAAYFRETAHEFFHTWNLVRLRPVARGELRTAPPPPTNELWWSEGATIFYAMEIEQRAGLFAGGETRSDRLARDLARYLANPAYGRISPERASATSGMPPGTNGDYSADYYLSGQLIAEVLGLTLRDSTGGRRGADDLMRALYARHTGDAGFSGADIEREASATCGCDLRPFFDRYVRHATPLDFDAALGAIGLRMHVSWEIAADSAGHPLPDARIFAIRTDDQPAGAPLRVIITRPQGVWALHGLHSGDELLALDGQPVSSSADLRRRLAAIQVAEPVTVVFTHEGRRTEASFLMDVYVAPRVTLEEVPGATPAARRLRARWLAGE